MNDTKIRLARLPVQVSLRRFERACAVAGLDPARVLDDVTAEISAHGRYGGGNSAFEITSDDLAKARDKAKRFEDELLKSDSDGWGES